jgi:hypothetical protein
MVTPIGDSSVALAGQFGAVDESGQSAESDPGGSVVGDEQSFELVGIAFVAFERLGQCPHDPFGVGVFDRQSCGLGDVRGDPREPFVVIGFGDAAQHRIDESRGLGRRALDDGDGLGQGRMVGDSHRQQLVGAQTHRGQGFGVDLVDGAGGGDRDDRVVELLPPQRPVGQFGGEGGVLGVEMGAGEFRGQEQVRIGVLRRHVEQDLPGDPSRQVLADAFGLRRSAARAAPVASAIVAAALVPAAPVVAAAVAASAVASAAPVVASTSARDAAVA